MATSYVMATSSLKRTGRYTFTALVVAKASPANWTKETTILRLAEKNGAETVLTATGNARQSFASVQLWRIYNIEITGACVKNAVLCGRYGISALLEIRLSYPCGVTLSKEAWPFLHNYDLCPCDDLNQVAEKTLVDVVGRATEDVSLDPVSSLASRPRFRARVTASARCWK